MSTPTSSTLSPESAPHPPPLPSSAETSTCDQTSKPSPEQIAHQVLTDHQAKLFRPPNRPFNIRDIQIPDSFFEPTTTELKHVYSTYTQRTQDLQNAVMKTKKMRQAEEEQRMKCFRHVYIRIQFPDRVILQGVFQPQSTLRQVRRFVRAALLDARNVKFHFFLTPPKVVLSDFDVTLWSQRLVPAALLHLAIDDGPPDSTSLLKNSLVSKITDVPELLNANQTKQSEQTNSTLTLGGAENDKASETSKSNVNKSQRKVPKWFKK